MRNLNSQAWEMLLDDEKQALILQHGHNKSSWKAGEIMIKSHYKYLEIKYRAERFLKIFTEHINIFGEIIPKYVGGGEEVKEYFYLCIVQRLKLKDVSIALNTKYKYNLKRDREKDILNQMEKWGISTNAYEQTLYNLIKDFDRWNNFRILPQEIQEPSAFNRRLKNIHKKHLRVASKFPDISVPMVTKLYGHKKGTKAIYLPIITEHSRLFCLKLRDVKTTQKDITSLNLYMFYKEQQARDYLELAKTYLFKDKEDRRCKDGLIFWPKYRELMKLAANYEAIQKIVPSRKYLEQALSKLSFL